MDDDEDYRREAFYDEVAASIYPEHREKAISEFTTECFQRFYLANPDILSGPLGLLSEARSLRPEHASAALVFAVAAIETGLKLALLSPVVSGLVHDEAFAEVLASLVTGPASNLERLQKLVLGVVNEHAGMDLVTFKRDGVATTLWEEMLHAQKVRNAVIHRGEKASREDAEVAISIAAFVLETIFAKVIANLELHQHGESICPVPGRSVCSGKPPPWNYPEITGRPSATLQELRDFIRSKRAALAGFIQTGADLELKDDVLIVTPRVDIYTTYLSNNAADVARLASELYSREIRVQLREAKRKLNDIRAALNK